MIRFTSQRIPFQSFSANTSIVHSRTAPYTKNFKNNRCRFLIQNTGLPVLFLEIPLPFAGFELRNLLVLMRPDSVQHDVDLHAQQVVMYS